MIGRTVTTTEWGVTWPEESDNVEDWGADKAGAEHTAQTFQGQLVRKTVIRSAWVEAAPYEAVAS